MGKEYCEGRKGQDEKSLRNEQTTFEWGTNMKRGIVAKWPIALT